MLIWNQNLFFWLSVLSSSKMERFLMIGWSLIDFDDTKTLFICLLIKLFSVLEMYLIPKAKTPLKVLKIQHLRDGFESSMDRIWISILEGEENWKRGEGFESFCQRFESLSNRNSRSAFRQRREFCPCFGYFMAWSISDKNEDKIKNLAWLLILDHFELIYYVKNGSKEVDRIPFPESCKKPILKGGFESPRYGFESLFQNVKKMDPRRHGFKSLSQVQKLKNNMHNG